MREPPASPHKKGKGPVEKPEYVLAIMKNPTNKNTGYTQTGVRMPYKLLLSPFVSHRPKFPPMYFWQHFGMTS